MPPRKSILIFSIASLSVCGCKAQEPQKTEASELVESATEYDPPVTNNPDCGETAVYRFDAVSPDGSDNRRIFIDFERASTGIVSRGSAATVSHTGGYATDCSTQELRCVAAILLVFAWPKDESQTTFALGNGQCQLTRGDEAAQVSCFVGQEIVYRYRVVEGAIDQAELFYHDYPEYPHQVFESVDEPLPLCKL